jgi:hypothetical protein
MKTIVIILQGVVILMLAVILISNNHVSNGYIKQIQTKNLQLKSYANILESARDNGGYIEFGNKVYKRVK